MTTPDTAAIRAQMETLDGFTPGPWDWEVSRRSQTVELCGGKGASDLTVMSFARWGLNKAAPVFWFWLGNVSDEPKRAEALGTPEPGREHHADWFQRINHPDARLIAAAPDMRETILALCDALDELRTEVKTLRRQAETLKEGWRISDEGRIEAEAEIERLLKALSKNLATNRS